MLSLPLASGCATLGYYSQAVGGPLEILNGRRWVGEGRIVTSADIDMSLHLVERIAGRALAERTARQMEFDWTENA